MISCFILNANANFESRKSNFGTVWHLTLTDIGTLTSQRTHMNNVKASRTYFKTVQEQFQNAYVLIHHM